jgi:signal transduction histidine kinase
MGPLRPVVSLSMIVAVLAVILGLSIASARRERHRLLDELAATARQQTHASIDVLSARLDALDQDTRILTDLVERSWTSPEHDSATERRLAVTAFRALAVVVPHYRVISLNRQNGGIEILAVDPTETEATVGALSPHIEQMAREVSTRRVKAIGEPARYGARSFLLYGVPVRGGGAVVVTSDAAMFLGAGTWTPLPASRLFVTDPGGVVWAGCETPGGCRATDSDTVKTYFANATGVSEIGAGAAGTLGVGRAPAVQASEGIDRPTGRWVVTWVASTRAIMDRERWLISRIALAAVAAALTVAGVGMMILRQQRRAFALEGELRYARALADARDLENQLVRAEKLITVGVLSTEMAHEIGSPLAVIRGRAEQVLREVSAGPRAEDLRVIIKHIDNVSTTIRQILDFARRPANERRPVALESALERARELLQWRLDARSLTLEVALSPELPALSADPDQLQQVLVNLTLNACDASDAGGKVEVTAGVIAEGMVRIDIVDHGSGIAPENMNAVFDPFFTTKQRGQGTGLGLPIAASIVRNHGGQIALTSVPGQGTTARVTWPAAPEPRETHA